jgi:hypothetical protein
MADYFPGSRGRRDLWVADQPPVCWICGYDWSEHNDDMRRCHTHHIERRSQCYPKYHDVECNLFRACEDCHETKLAAMPHADQLAYKYEHDAGNVSLSLWRQCKYGPGGGSEDRVSPLDVWRAWKLIFGERRGDPVHPD